MVMKPKPLTLSHHLQVPVISSDPAEHKLLAQSEGASCGGGASEATRCPRRASMLRVEGLGSLPMDGKGRQGFDCVGGFRGFVSV